MEMLPVPILLGPLLLAHVAEASSFIPFKVVHVEEASWIRDEEPNEGHAYSNG